MKKNEYSDIYKFLSENGYIDAGYIDRVVLAKIFRNSDFESKDYRLDLMALREELQDKGHFCKTELGSLKIYSENQSGYESRKRANKFQRGIKTTEKIMSKIDIDKITDKKCRNEFIHSLNLVQTLNRKSKLLIKETKVYLIE